jgi:acyl-CoA thioester hydrolase
MFKYYFRVRYGECDAQKVVFNSRYGDYTDISVVEFLRAAGLQGQMVTGPYDYQLVKQTVEWKAPARFDQVIEASVGVKHLGNTSFTLMVEFRIAGDAKIIATSETIYVLMLQHSLEKVPLTDDLRSGLQHGAEGKTTDHAAYLTSDAAGVGL